MKVLVETLPNHEPIANPEASVVLGDTGHMDDVYAADEAVHRVLDGRESRTAVFKREDIVALQGLERALESGEYDTSGTGIQVIPAEVSRPLLAAMELYATIPEEEKAHLTDTEKHKWSIAVAALEDVDIVELEPGVSPQEVLEEIIPDLAKPQVKKDDGYDFEWLYSPSDKKAGGNIPQPIRYATTIERRDPSSDMRLFKEPPAADMKVGVDVSISKEAQLSKPEPNNQSSRQHTPSETAAHIAAMSQLETQDGLPKIDAQNAEAHEERELISH